mmetsp:Transcript_8662/g.22841  ORF Transcript_8662/g.22841 Transcript_8662/m.22841 type:complete len:255 (-) Transcript_8662:748-1512(-)
MTNTCPSCIRSPDARTHTDLHPSWNVEEEVQVAYRTHLFSGQLPYSRHPTSSSFEALSRTSVSWRRMNSCILRRRWISSIPNIRTASKPAFAALPIATVATGTPRGICTMDSSESLPESAEDFTGTPITGRGVIAATIPGRCAAPPAPAMIARKPRCSAVAEYSYRRWGVRWADTMVSSKGTPNSVSTSAAARIVGRSESEPMITPTTAGGAAVISGEFPSSAARRASTDLPSLAVTLMWPILRLAFGGDLPYQ